VTTPQSIDQLRDAARRRLPGFAFDFIDGGAGREYTISDNVAALARLRLVPRILRGVTTSDLTTTLFGQTYGAPFGIAPMGLPAIAWPGADFGLASAAAAANIPFVLSTAASATIEAATAIAAKVTWFQLYPSRDPAYTAQLIDRAEAAGVRVLVLTVDRPVMGWRTRDLTNGVGLQMKLNARACLSLAAHPRWSLATLRAGKPRPANPEPAQPPGAAVALDWGFLTMLRGRWPHTLLVKGVLHPDDARQAVGAGADGVIVSNHGGAHLESAATSIARLAVIRVAVGDKVAVLLDGGMRSGEDIAKALALGADFVLLGRAFAWSVAALGSDKGPVRAIAMLRDQFSRTLTLLGCRFPADLTRDHIEEASVQ
jgi:(S)-mandelate dehydrogenase